MKYKKDKLLHSQDLLYTNEKNKAPLKNFSFSIRLFGMWLFRHLNWSENWQNPPETTQALRPQVSEEGISGYKAL